MFNTHFLNGGNALFDLVRVRKTFKDFVIVDNLLEN